MRAGLRLFGIVGVVCIAIGCGSNADALFEGGGPVTPDASTGSSDGSAGAKSDSGTHDSGQSGSGGGTAGSGGGSSGSGGGTAGSGGGTAGSGGGSSGSGGGTAGSGGFSGMGGSDGGTGGFSGFSGSGGGTGGSGGGTVVHTKCGWIPQQNYYGCDGSGTSPNYPIDCPSGLVQGTACGGLTKIGCCDASDNTWYCSGGVVVTEVCGNQTTSIKCGKTTCSAGQACCLTSQGGSCASGSGACQGTSLKCTSSDQCGNGQICCGTQNNGVYKEFACSDKCDGDAQYEMCDNNNPNCIGGGDCQASSKLPGYYVCQ